MPPGMGALFGSLFGLLGVAGSAWLGFQALVKSREREAELARERDAELREAEMATVASALRVCNPRADWAQLSKAGISPTSFLTPPLPAV